MKQIQVIFAGGTFSMKMDEKTGGAVPFYNGSQLLERIPQAEGLAKISVFEFGNLPSPHMTPEKMLDLSQTVESYIKKEEIDGVIVTHGTDTLEETAYLLDLTIKTEKPIVVIGAMKTSSEPDWDGAKNFEDAVHIINSENSKGLSILVCLNGEINAASEVTKTHTENVETFHSLDFGALGFVDRGRVFFNRAPRLLEVIETKNINTNVDLIKTYSGMDERFFKFSADNGVDGIVVEAMGIGNVPPKVFDGIKYARDKGIPVVLVSRCPAGETLDAYSYVGAGKWLKKEGVIFAEYLNGQKARIKLMLCLSVTRKLDELEEMFYI